MTITECKFSLCPAKFHIIYKDDNGKDKWFCGYGMAICYTCPEFIIKRLAWEKERGGDTE